jgi:hypothetical protein
MMVAVVLKPWSTDQIDHRRGVALEIHAMLHINRYSARLGIKNPQSRNQVRVFGFMNLCLSVFIRG